ncbi:MAG: ATP-grasp domain-containing protein [Candidatus Pacebacteria bacterium]|nr:ATP-grasp domain-containing protein [Candidatus Paceibacterota bacterium]
MKIAIITGGNEYERVTSLKSSEYIESRINFAEISRFLYPEDFELFLKQMNSFDLVIPVIHGHPAEDGYLQAIFEKNNIGYLFSNSHVSKNCFNKTNAKEYISKIDCGIPKTFLMKDGDLKFPLIAKPQENGSSVGIYFIEKYEDLIKLNLPDDYLLEEYVRGTEYTVGVLDFNNKIFALPIMEVRKKGAIFNEREKTTSLSKDIEVFPENLNQNLRIKLKKIARDIHSEFGIKNFSRTDFIVTDNQEIYFIEVNTIPGCSENSFIPKMIEKEDLDFKDILRYWIKKELR